MEKTPISEAAIYRADFLLKYYFRPFSGAKNGLGPVAVASFTAGQHIRKTIETLIDLGTDEWHLDFYYQVYARLVAYDNTHYRKGEMSKVFCSQMHGII